MRSASSPWRLVRAPVHFRRLPSFRRGQQADVPRTRQAAAGSRACEFSASRPSTTTAPPRSWSTAASWRPRRRSASPARSRTRAFPTHAIAYCLAEARHPARRGRLCGVLREAVPEIRAAARDLCRRSRRAATARSRWRSRVWIREKLFQKNLIGRELHKLAPDFDWSSRLLFTEHHVSHAASAFYASPFQDAAVLTMDGVGEWCTTSVGGRARQRADDRQGAAFPAFARAALFGVHLLHRLQGQFRRVQADGARPLRRAEIRRPSFSIT